MRDFPIWGDCEGCKFDDGRDYDEEPCCYCRRNINLEDEYRKNDEEEMMGIIRKNRRSD